MCFDFNRLLYNFVTHVPVSCIDLYNIIIRKIYKYMHIITTNSAQDAHV